MRALAGLLAALLLTSCFTGDEAAIPIGPVEVRVDKRGGVEVFLGAEFATPVGDFRAGAAIDVIDALNGPEKWYVVVRRTNANGDRMEKVYELESDAGLRVESNGRLVEEFSEHRVLIEVPKGQERSIQISPIEDGEVTTSDGEVVLLPRRVLGRWTGGMRGGDHHVWSNAPNEYKPDTSVVLTLFGGEVGQPVGEFRYDRWDCEGLLILDDVEEHDLDDDGRTGEVSLSQLILRNHGDEATCGGFTKNNEGDPDLEVSLTKRGRLKVETGNRRTSADDEVVRRIETTLRRLGSR